jgi:hypothetical protein
VTLSSSDVDSGVNYTEYSLDAGMNWNKYMAPLLITKEGQTDIQYHSLDKVNNQETTKSVTVKIDKAPPEMGVSFDPSTKKFTIIGINPLSGPSAVNYPLNITMVTESRNISVSEIIYGDKFIDEVSKFLVNPKSEDRQIANNLPSSSLNKQTFIIHDKADNALELTVSVNITKKEAELSILNIKYNGVETAIPQNAFVAKWSDKSGSITHLEQAVFVQGQVSILATYNGKATKITTYKFLRVRQ